MLAAGVTPATVAYRVYTVWRYLPAVALQRGAVAAVYMPRACCFLSPLHPCNQVSLLDVKQFSSGKSYFNAPNLRRRGASVVGVYLLTAVGCMQWPTADRLVPRRFAVRLRVVCWQWILRRVCRRSSCDVLCTTNEYESASDLWSRRDVHLCLPTIRYERLKWNLLHDLRLTIYINQRARADDRMNEIRSCNHLDRFDHVY